MLYSGDRRGAGGGLIDICFCHNRRASGQGMTLLLRVHCEPRSTGFGLWVHSIVSMSAASGVEAGP
jgi:hypothetical protein